MRRLTPDQKGAVIEALVDLAPWYDAHNERGDGACLPTSRVAIDVLRRFGVKADPLVVRCDIYNPTMLAMLDRAGRQPTEDEAPAWRDQGAWIVSLGNERSPERSRSWAGHMVIRVEGRYLVDLTIMQAQRLHKEIKIDRPLVGRLPADFRPAQPFGLDLGDCRVVYVCQDLFPERWRSAPGWLAPTGRGALIDYLAAEVERRLRQPTPAAGHV